MFKNSKTSVSRAVHTLTITHRGWLNIMSIDDTILFFCNNGKVA